jgi:hypothetical protein
MATAPTIPTVSAEVAQLLSQYITPITKNKRRILVTALETPRERNQLQAPAGRNFSLQTTTARDFVSHYQTKVVDHIEIPAMLYSKETYEFMGFDSPTAQQLWNYFSNPYAPRTFLETAVGYIDGSQVADCTSQGHDWDNSMRQLGMDQELRNSMLNPIYGDVRYTNSLKWWVIMCVEDRYYSLLDINDRLRQESPRLVGQDAASRISATVSGSPRNRKPTPQPNAESSSQSPVLLTWAQRASGMTAPTPSRGFMGRLMGPLMTPASNSRVPPPPAPLTITDSPKYREGYQTLWKVALSWRINRLYNKETGKVNLQSNGSVPGDFSGDRKVTYWTPEKETADEFVGFCRNLNKKADYSILQLYVPNDWISTLNDIKFANATGAPVQNWFKVVHNCRNNQFWPPELIDVYEKLDLATGPILNGRNCKYQEEGKQWSDIRIQDCLFIEREEDHHRVHAQQWVFYGARTTAAFNAKCNGQGCVHYLGRMETAAAKD